MLLQPRGVRALGPRQEALADYGRAFEIDPAHAAAAFNRGMLRARQGRHEQALADLRTALKHGADAAIVHYDVALVLLAANDPAGPCPASAVRCWN